MENSESFFGDDASVLPIHCTEVSAKSETSSKSDRGGFIFGFRTLQDISPCDSSRFYSC